MARTGAEIARAARDCIGVRFRAQGHDPRHGLDCVGLAAVAFGREALTRDYALRGGDPERIGKMIRATGLAPVEPEAAGEGDLLLLRSGTAQLHFAVLTGSGFVHADAGLRRVVETPGAPRWTIIGAWREGGE